MYIWPLNYKNYIALLLVAIIFTKFVAVDSKLLGTLFNSDEIAFVNQSCKNNHYQTSPEQEGFSEDTFVLNISYHSFCNLLFTFEIEQWTDEVAELSFKNFGAPIVKITTSHNSKISPPPKL